MFGFNGMGQPVPQQYGQQHMYPFGAGQQYGQQLQQRQVDRVAGIEGARMFPLGPNSAAALFDNSRDIFYWKTTDSGGFPTVRAFAFTEIDLSTGQTAAESMSRQEIESMIQEGVQRYAEQFIRNYTSGAGASSAAEHGAAGSPAQADV